jgi:hypothetical protein
LYWPCGQDPGRKPEARQHASTREAMSLGEQDSTCRASSLCVAARYGAESRKLKRESAEAYSGKPRRRQSHQIPASAPAANT